MHYCLDQAGLGEYLWMTVLIVLTDIEDPAHCGRPHSLALEPEAGGQPGLHSKTLNQKERNIQTTADHNFIWWFDLSHLPVSLISKGATFALFH